MNEHVQESNFRGERCYRFTPAYQLLYTVAHWGADPKWPVNVLSIVDTCRIASSASDGPDWELINNTIDAEPWLGNCIVALLTYLQATNIMPVPPALMRSVEAVNSAIGERRLKISQRLLHEIPMSGCDRVFWILSADWSAQVFWRKLMLYARKPFAIVRAAVATVLDRRNRFSPAGIAAKATRRAGLLRVTT